MAQSRSRIISLGGGLRPPESEFAGQPFVSVYQSNWKENGSGIVVLSADSGIIGSDRPVDDAPSQLHINSRPGFLAIRQSLQGSAEDGFAEEPDGYEEQVRKGTLHGLTMERQVTPSYDDRTGELLDLSARGPERDFVVVGVQIDELRASLDRSTHPLAVHAAALIEVATKRL